MRYLRSSLASGAVMFLLVGAIGFVIDGSLLTALSTTVGMNVYLSRALSFATATVTTWWLNREITFRVTSDSPAQIRNEYLRYVAVQIGGALLNLGVFSLLIWRYPELRHIPIIPLAIGALFGLVFNYNGSRHWVYRLKSG